ncbi:MAG: hypothetical protein R3344_12685, partial [Acidobacteriota bacterium]|nr:hypothetical protein [Acidobacteriota bacterium]
MRPAWPCGRRRPAAVLAWSLCACASPTPDEAEGPLPIFPFDVVEATIPEMRRAMEAGELTSRFLVDEYLRRIAAYDHEGPGLNTMIRLNPD